MVYHPKDPARSALINFLFHFDLLVCSLFSLSPIKKVFIIISGVIKC